MKRAVSLFGSLFLMIVVLQITSPTAGAVDPTFTKGDVFVGVSDNTVQWRHADGMFVQNLTTAAPDPAETTGMGFDAAGHLYVTNFDANEVSKFDTDGTLLGTFGGPYNADPESILFDSSGNAYVGQADGTQDVLKFDPTGGSLATYDPAIESRGTDWIDLAADQCTLFYTSEGLRVKRFNVCTNTQLADFTPSDLPGTHAYALRILPGGGALVADTEQLVRLDSSGAVVQTYDAEGEDFWFALNLDPDGTHFWSAGYSSKNVYKFDIATGSSTLVFNASDNCNGCSVPIVDGLGIAGELTVSQPQADLSITKTDGNPAPCPNQDPSNPESPPIPCGPDPVSSGQPVAYGISVTNNGPDLATGITVVDTPEEGVGTVQSGFGDNWDCTVDTEGNTVTCTYGPTLDAGDTAEPLTVVVKAPTNSGTSDTFMTDQASVTGDQFDPDGENDSATETTTVTGSGESGAKDHAQGFFDNINTLTISTTRDPQGRFYSSITIHPDDGLFAGVVTINEIAGTTPPYNTLCGGKPCDAQVQVSGLPTGATQANNAMQIHIIYVKDTKQSSTVWVRGENEVIMRLSNCIVRGIANPPKCINSKTILRNGDRNFYLLFLDGSDPWTGKK